VTAHQREAEGVVIAHGREEEGFVIHGAAASRFSLSSLGVTLSGISKDVTWGSQSPMSALLVLKLVSSRVRHTLWY
jgi:hypothetical protein